MEAVVKDVLDVAGTRTGAGNPTFLEMSPVAERNAPGLTRLLDAGVRIVGKSHTDEFAFSLSGTNIHYGTPLNPAAPGRIPGGSSSGSASAVAGGLVPLAVGTDTAGSVRVPASYCGVYGFRPTQGRVPLAGVVPLAPCFDTIGLLASSGDLLASAGQLLIGEN
ncbi:MAG TPA: amidase family protein, partial [Acidimicrobiales bacterium]|nr:amidase family protein [Acidimicrobiales bacterium]